MEKLDKNTKIALWVGATLVVGVGAYFAFRKPKEDSTNVPVGTTDDSNKMGNKVGMIISDLGSILEKGKNIWDMLGIGKSSRAGASYKVGFVTFKTGDTKDFMPHISVNKRPEKGKIVIGDNIAISNMGKYDGAYKVLNVWIDENGKIGSVHLKAPEGVVTTSTVKDWSFDNKGVITVL